MSIVNISIQTIFRAYFKYYHIYENNQIKIVDLLLAKFTQTLKYYTILSKYKIQCKFSYA